MRESQRIQKIRQVGLLLSIKREGEETALIKADDRRYVRRRTVVKIRCPRREAAQDRHLHLADVLALSGDQARPGSKVNKVWPSSGPVSQWMVKAGSGSAGATRDGSEVPMSRGPSTERLPRLGVS